MFALFYKSLGRHFKWWCHSFLPRGRAAAPLGLRRLLFLFIVYPVFLLLQLLHWFAFLLDEICCPGYRRVRIEEPVFIVGIPRSGTTFLHRTLAADADTFTSLTTWEALLAPSIVERKLFRILGGIDRRLGSPLRRILDACMRKGTGGLDAIHQVDPVAAEEDYLALLPAGGCFFLSLAFPFARELHALSELDTLPEKEKLSLMVFYRRILQKHLYAHPGKRLLSKNAAFSSWCPVLKTVFPDASFLICIRDPDTAISSQLSSLESAQRIFGIDPLGSGMARRFTAIFRHSYSSLARFTKEPDAFRRVVVAHALLKTAPAACIRAALERAGIPLSAELLAVLEPLMPHEGSGHRHHRDDFPIDFTHIELGMRPDYEAILRCPHCIRLTVN